MASAINNMTKAIETYRKRNKLYGDNYKEFSKVMTALYPKGMTLKTEQDWNRFGIIVMIASKLTRYVQKPHKGHPDSIHDLGVYAFMLEELDSIVEQEPAMECERILDRLDCPHVFKEGFCVNCGEPVSKQASK